MALIDRLKLLAGVPILMPDYACAIYPITLKEIAVLGSENFFKYINLLTISKEEILAMIKEEIDPFDFILVNCTYKEEFKSEILDALEFFTKEDIIFVPEMEVFVVGDIAQERFLSKDNFEKFQLILKAQNCVFEDAVKCTGEDEMAKRIKEKLAKANETLNRLKRNEGEKKVELADLISSVCINSSINIIEIWNVSYYTFNDQFKRMRTLEQYNTGLQSIMAGADPKKIKLQDWIKNIQ